MEQNKYYEGCYVKEEKWIKYCKGVKRKTYQGLPVQIILPNDTVVAPEEYWKSKEKKKGRWKPKDREIYYFIDSFGRICRDFWTNNLTDNYRYSVNNVAKTEEELEEKKKKEIYQQQYKDYAMEHNDEIDWKNYDQYKYLACYDHGKNEIKIAIIFCKYQGIIHFTNKQDILDFIKLIGEEEFKKYVLEIEDK